MKLTKLISVLFALSLACGCASAQQAVKVDGTNNLVFPTTGINLTSGQTLGMATGASLPRIPNLTSNGFVKTGSGNGTLSIDTTSYLPASAIPGGTGLVYVSSGSLSALPVTATGNNLFNLDSITSVATFPLILATGTSGTALTFASATNDAAFASTADVSGTTAAVTDAGGLYVAKEGFFGTNLLATGNVQAASANITGSGVLTVGSGTIQDTGSALVVKSVATQPLQLFSGTSGTGLTIASATGNANFGANVAVTGNVAPNTDNLYTLGLSTSNRWSTVFAVTFNGALTGNASTATTATSAGTATTATTLATPRAINGVNFDGSAPITVTAAAGTLTGTTLASGVTASSLTSVGTLNTLAVSSGITQTGGIVGLVAGGAGAGNVGENIDGEAADTTASVSPATVTNCFGSSTVAAALTGGDWDISFEGYISTSSVTATQVTCGIAFSATPAFGNTWQTVSYPVSMSGVTGHFKFAGTTTQSIPAGSENVYLYLSWQGSGTLTAGGHVHCRRSANAK